MSAHQVSQRADQDVEPLFPLAKLAGRFPSADGRPMHLSTLIRWITKGVRGPGGARVFLRATRAGGRWFCSESVVRDFLAALTPTRPESDVDKVTPARRRREIDRAVRRADAVLGVTN